MLNEKRKIPYAFRVAEHEGWAWLFDDSSRTFICSQDPMIWAEPLYYLGDDEAPGFNYATCTPEPDYHHARGSTGWEHKEMRPVLHRVNGSLQTWGEEVPEEEAWDEAREEAHANHVL